VAGRGTDPRRRDSPVAVPEVLEQIEKDQARIAELEGLFAAANASDDEEGEAEEADTEAACCPRRW